MFSQVIAQVGALEDAAAQESLTRDSAILAEQFYFFTVVLMWLIHAGFMSYEAGVARRKNVMSTAMKNILTIAVVTPSFYYFGWMIYGCAQPGIPISPAPTTSRPHVRPPSIMWSDAFGPNLDEQHQPDLLPGLPSVLVDDGLDHVRRDHRARSDLRLPRARRPCSARWCGSSTPRGAGAPADG